MAPQAQHFAKQASGSWFLPLSPLAVVRGLALAAGLAVFTKYAPEHGPSGLERAMGMGIDIETER